MEYTESQCIQIAVIIMSRARSLHLQLVEMHDVLQKYLNIICQTDISRVSPEDILPPFITRYVLE